ncbi:MAG: DUF1592 domain-containing protein [Deltaproteobacteria bacterium]|nr:DUF1592 domain-containing protein [Deltaproteobacteria bacterium]
MRPITARVNLPVTDRRLRPALHTAALCLGLLGVSACERTELGGLDLSTDDGLIDPGTDAGAPDAVATKPREKPTGTLCVADDSAENGDRPLTRMQYINSLQDVFVATIGVGAAEKLMASLGDALLKLPADRYPEGHRTGFRREVRELDMLEIEARIRIAQQASVAFSVDRDALTLLGPCGETASTIGTVAKCFRQFVSRFAERAYRRPLDNAELDVLSANHAPADRFVGDAIRKVVSTVLANREFYYRIARGAEPVVGQAGVFELSTFELAARLSYHLMDAPPDEALRQAASDRSLRNPAVYAEQIERLLNSEAGRLMLAGFFFDYLGLAQVPDPATITDPRFVALAGTERPTAEFHSHVIAEAVDMGVMTVRKGASLAELFTEGRSYARTPDLAAIYGAPVWDGVSDPPRITNRPGILSHAWFNLADGVQSRPLRKGAQLRSHFLCENIPFPPGLLTPPPIAPGLTGRENIDAIYRNGGSVCLTCHGSMAPLGYAFETYDVLGRVRTEETVYDGNGQPNGKKPVNSTAVPQVVEGDLRPVTGPADFVSRLVESGKLSSCFAAQVYQFTLGRPVVDSKQSCAIAQLTEHAEHFSLRDTFAASARLAEFTRVRR